MTLYEEPSKTVSYQLPPKQRKRDTHFAKIRASPFICPHKEVNGDSTITFVSFEVAENSGKVRSQPLPKKKVPKNSFIMARSLLSKYIRKNYGAKSAKEVSKVLSILWKDDRNTCFREYFKYLAVLDTLIPHGKSMNQRPAKADSQLATPEPVFPKRPYEDKSKTKVKRVNFDKDRSYAVMRISFNKEIAKKEPVAQPGLISNRFVSPLGGIVSEDLFLMDEQKNGQNFDEMSLETAFADTLQHVSSDQTTFDERNSFFDLPSFSEGPCPPEEDFLQDDIFNVCFPM